MLNNNIINNTKSFIKSKINNLLKQVDKLKFILDKGKENEDVDENENISDIYKDKKKN